MNLDMGRKLCLTGSESPVHVLFNCPVVLDVWSRVGFQNIAHCTNSQLMELLSLHLKLTCEESIPLAQRQAIPWILWTIWKNRNSILYADTHEWERPKPGRRPDIFPKFSPMKTPLPPPMPYDPPAEDEEEEEEKKEEEEENPDQEEEEQPEKQQ
ncbi:hypothetical protein F2Q70_00029423 [Brassica cretica]|uniref:Reverse transcriptase zinc-binding domain-containing protein n=1 Tax=Brassica cretica TaxID=69181 RepID=A0A8S9FIG4_BRACR|nr:hypothetical protein F2Q70_00029423 [Brassica cretica]